MGSRHEEEWGKFGVNPSLSRNCDEMLMKSEVPHYAPALWHRSSSLRSGAMAQKSEVPHYVPALWHRSSSLRSGAIAQNSEVVFKGKIKDLRFSTLYGVLTPNS